MKNNRYVRRETWPENWWLHIITPPANRVGAEVYLAILTREGGHVMPWTPNSTDLLADDWEAYDSTVPE